MFRTCVYYPNWNVYSKGQTPDSIPNLDNITNLFYSFFQINEHGFVKPSDDWCDLEKKFGNVNGLFAKCFELKRKYRNIKISISIGGWSFRNKFKIGLKSKNGIENFVKSSIHLIMQYGFDGIDLDWEYPSDQNEIYLYLTLVKSLYLELRSLEASLHIDRNSFLLSIATPAVLHQLKLWDLVEFDKYLSFWNLMTYDFAGSWSSKASYHCNLYSVKYSESSIDLVINYFIQKNINPKKLIIGMAAYGRSFTHTKGYGYSFNGVGKGPDEDDDEGIWNYKNLPIKGTVEQYDSNAHIAWCYDPISRTFISYDNLQSCFNKGIYVKDKNLGGGMFWESSGIIRNNEFGLVNSFVNGIGNKLIKDKNLIDCFNESEYIKENSFF